VVLTQTGTTTPFGYAGQYTDAATGLQYLRARYYDPTTQQFLTVDPLLAQTEQAYAYAGGSPTNATDPSGLAKKFFGDTGSWLDLPAKDVDLFPVVTTIRCNLVNICSDAELAEKKVEELKHEQWLKEHGPIMAGTIQVFEWPFESVGGGGGICIPGRPFRGENAPEQAYEHLEEYHGLDPKVASNRLHILKQHGGLGAADDVIIGRTGDVYNAKTGENLGNLTDPTLGRER